MAELGLRSGSKLDLEFDGQIVKSTFFQEMSDGSCLVSVPMKNGESCMFAPSTQLLVRYTLGGQHVCVNGTVTGVVEQGVRAYLKLMLTKAPSNAERRRQVRVAIELPLVLTSGKRSNDGALPSQTLDLSSGGAAVLTDAAVGIGEVVQVAFQIDGLESKPFRAEICWVRRAPEGSHFSTALGVRFLLEKAWEAETLETLMQAKA